MNPTPEQKLAIESSGKNIIVSAGAGSGKTAVLSERVLTKIQNGVDIDRLLILTFTKAAASEMKERIRKKIKKSNNKEQLNKIDNSYITTFDSFSLSLVKKYHYLLNIKQNVNIIEANVLKLQTKEYLDAIMEEEYACKREDFNKLIDDFCLKDDEDLKKIILALNDKLNMKYNKKEYLNHYLDTFYSDTKIKEIIEDYEKLIEEEVKVVDTLLVKLSNFVDSDYYYKISVIIKALIDGTNYAEIKNSVNLINRLPSLPKGSDEEAKRIKESLKKQIDRIKDLTSYIDIDDIRTSIMLTKPYMQALLRIIKNLDERIERFKEENDLYDFVDISKLAIKIVKENANIREEIKNFFEEIMVDEYQDTSDLQETFINLISNNNLYMVGDVKQSIYRFRNANPNIFRGKYNDYAKSDGGMKIDLLKNFRSREEVLANVNLIFDYIMSDSIGGANYIQEHRMVFGNNAYNEEGLTKQNNNLDIYTYDIDSNEEFKPNEIEAFIIANDIEKKIKEHYQIFDKDKKILRDANYSDFCILIDRSSSFELYKKVFLYKKIPLSIEKDEYLTNSSLLSCIKSVYKLINLLKTNGRKEEIEYAFLSIGRSFLFNYDDEEIFNVIKNNKYEETDMFKHIRKILENIDDKSISQILDEIIIEFNVYEKLRTIPLLSDNYKKIEYLYTLSETLNQMGYTYEDFVSFIDNIFDSKSEIRFAVNKEDGQSVRIMTIHKSKGLEYHICYFPELFNEFNTKELNEKVNYSNDLGIIVPYDNDGLEKNCIYELYKKNYLNDEISEKIRLFYVALTRAKEKMIFILQKKIKDEEYDKDGLVDSNLRMHYRSFADIMYSIDSKIKQYEKDIDVSSLSLTKDYNLINSSNLFSNLNVLKDKIEMIHYPKYVKTKIETSHFSKGNTKLITKKEKEAMEFGTLMHYYLETLDLQNPDYSGIDSNYVSKIQKFLQSPFVCNLSDAKIYQEYEFIYEEDNTLMHGIIDLLIEHADYIDIIDYKLKNIDDVAYDKQLNGYRDYISKIKEKDVNIYLYSIIDEKYRKI